MVKVDQRFSKISHFLRRKSVRFCALRHDRAEKIQMSQKLHTRLPWIRFSKNSSTDETMTYSFKIHSAAVEQCIYMYFCFASSARMFTQKAIHYPPMNHEQEHDSRNSRLVKFQLFLFFGFLFFIWHFCAIFDFFFLLSSKNAYGWQWIEKAKECDRKRQFMFEKFEYRIHSILTSHHRNGWWMGKWIRMDGT